MSDLRTHPRLSELLDHLREREDAVYHFYCDHNGLVTIGVGHLVDIRGAASVIAVRQARSLARRDDVTFSAIGAAPGTLTSVEDVEADWHRVKDSGRQHPEWRAPRFASISRLRLDSESVNALLNERVQQFLNQLYATSAFRTSDACSRGDGVRGHPIQPARVVLYGDDPEVETCGER